MKFVIRVNHFISLLKDNPEIGNIEVEEKGIRGYIISRHTVVFYRLKNDTIILLKFFDSRQNPDKRFHHVCEPIPEIY